MRYFTGKTMRREAMMDLAISLFLLQLSGWVIYISFMRLATRIQSIVAFLSMIVALAISIHIARRVYTTLRWYETLLDVIPLPIAYMNRHMVCCYENRAAGKSLDRSVYRDSALFREIPEGYEIAENVLARLEHRGVEYRVTLTPVHDSGRVDGYAVVFHNLQELVENYKSRAEWLEEIGRLLQKLNHISTDFTDSTTALAHCTRQQAESLYAVVSIINSAFQVNAVCQDDLRELRDAVASINACIEEGGAHAAEISQVADNIVDASHCLLNTVKVIKNLVG